MRKPFALGAAIGLLAAGLACAGQKPAQRAKQTTGILTGTVYCADTNLPARLAQIFLTRASDDSSGYQSFWKTDLEGRFTINISPGDYYVVAVLPGYRNLLGSLVKSRLEAMTSEERKKLLAEVTSVSISADQPAQVSIRLERGAEIDGTVMYDDGSPAVGLPVRLRLQSHEHEPGVPSPKMPTDLVYAQMPSTDDRGHFRILGVMPGEYLVSVFVQTEPPDTPAKNQMIGMIGDAFAGINVYLGDGLRASKAETIKVDGGGASQDADITIPLSKLHTIRGQVVLKSTGQPSAVAMVQLLYADTKESASMAIALNGEFEMHLVPEGSFVLRAAASPEARPSLAGDEMMDHDAWQTVTNVAAEDFAVSGGVQADGSAEMPLRITGDVEHVSIAVPDPPAREKRTTGAGEGQDAAPANPARNEP